MRVTNQWLVATKRTEVAKSMTQGQAAGYLRFKAGLQVAAQEAC
jgi:hypothetical protein